MSIEASDQEPKISNNETDLLPITINSDINPKQERRLRPLRACTARSAARLYPTAPTVSRKKASVVKKEKAEQQEEQQQCSKIITPLLELPSSPSKLPLWNLRSMWEFASILNFLNVFRPILNILVEFTAEELETALLTPNSILDDIHIPLLKAIPPVTRMALGRGTWVTVLCRKLRDWWHWVAEGDIPIVASQGTELGIYNELDPGIRVVILKALCDIRVEQEDIKNFIDRSLKQGIQLSVFRKERIGGDSHGVSYWYEDDPTIGHRLYREIKKVEIKKVKTKGVLSFPTISCQWETVATNLEEFEEVSEKLFSSKSRIETAVGKKLKNDMLPDIEINHKVFFLKKEKLLKKQHREALLLDSSYIQAIASGRALRDRKPVTYTFDDYDSSINEAIKVTKKNQQSPEPADRRETVTKPEASSNGRSNGCTHTPRHVSYDELSPKSFEETEDENKYEPLDRSNRRRQRPQRYSEKEFVEDVSDYEAEFDSDEDIVGEVVYDEEYLRSRKRRKVSSSSEGEEQSWGEENADDDEEEEDFVSSSESSDEPRRSKKVPTRSKKRETKLRSVDELQSGLRRSRRASRSHINYRHLEFSESEPESTKPDKLNGADERSVASNDMEYSTDSPDSQINEDAQETIVDEQVNGYNGKAGHNKEPNRSPEKMNIPGQPEGVGRRQFLDLNELAPGGGFDDGHNMMMKDDDRNKF
ncbi:Ddt domain-containing protein ddr4 [Thalictrum thalictroides]|uniref:Ddt domain-containing protein ddr4 n=1 Tax=Thalictrum thalictroides TaxID=46969 RepID=A0A7J6X737_THATH|nr:Ddt domain-containing protein ddr4 [Thalictrum thalictroides]